MKKSRILLLLSFAGVVVVGFFILAGLLSPNPRVGDESTDDLPKESATAQDSLTNLSVVSISQEIEQKTDISSGLTPEPNPTPHSRAEDEENSDEEDATEITEAKEDAEQLAEQSEAVEEKEALDQFLAEVTPENWRQARTELLSAYKDGTITKKSYAENKFWDKVGEVGGKKVADELLNDADSAYTKVLNGWGKADPQSLFDYFSKLDLKDSKIQNYLEQTNNRELPFIDQFSSGLVDGLLDAKNVEKIDDIQLNHMSEVVDYFVESDPLKGESLMREFTERVIKNRDLEGLKKWVSEYEEPELQAATAQRVIESGAFDEEPLEAVEFANSLASDKAKRTGLSSAYARLASGMNGHNPNLTAQELNAMENGTDRDFALNGFAHGLVRSDPKAALQWANSISNENFRKVVTKNISKRIKVELPNPKELP
tara:strand:+ start:2253 stop:3539 length:1287 start_codon:yes stop_codon:yes gene_type:complete